MKKLMLLAVLICMMGITVYVTVTRVIAAPVAGDGYYYYTDIVTSLRGVPIDSTCVGGHILIKAEAMRSYGFDIAWNADQRRLEIQDNGTNTVSLPDIQPQKNFGTPGFAAGRYNVTDIVTIMSGKVIESFNINGSTYIPASYLRNFGYDVIWNGIARTVHIQSKEPVTIVSRIHGITYCDGVLNRIVGGGSLSDDCTVKLTIPAFWVCLQDLNIGDYSAQNDERLSELTLYDSPAASALPDGIYAYGTKDGTYSAELAKAVVKAEHFTLSGYEILAEHIDESGMNGPSLYLHSYYVRVDAAHVLRVSMKSPSMDNEDARRAVIASLDFSYKEVSQTQPWDAYSYYYGLPDGYTLSGIRILNPSGKLVGIVGKSFDDSGYTAPEKAVLDSAKIRFDSVEIVSACDNGNYILKCVTLLGHGLYGMSDIGTAAKTMTVYAVAVCDKAHYVIMFIELSADDFSFETVKTIAENASIT
jgi:hypothetical protein